MILTQKLKILLLSVVGITALTFYSADNLKAANDYIKKTMVNTKKSITNKITGTQDSKNVISKPAANQQKQLQAEVPAAPQKQPDRNKTLASILADRGIANFGPGAKILVDKSEHTLSVLYNGTSLKTYHVELGDGGTGDKEVEGDHKTPEGTFYVTDKETMDPADQYLGSRWLGVSYPAEEDAERGLQQGLIDKQTYDDIVSAFNNNGTPPQETTLGGNIGIHGGGGPEAGSDWTWGCVGLQNSDIEDFYNYINVGTPIVIQ